MGTSELNKSVERNKKRFQDKIDMLDKEIGSSPKHDQLVEVAEELNMSFKEYELITKIEYAPLDDLGGSISIHLSFMPVDHYLKLWSNGAKYYISFYRKMEAAMEYQIPDTFNESGIAEMSGLDEFIDFFTDFIASKYYNRANTRLIK
jgi:hypothetical protein